MVSQPWNKIEGDGPVIATAIHAGHDLRPDIARKVQLGSQERLREEDPYTDVLTCVAPTRVIVNRSRFEVDLNRPLEKAVYLEPSDAWGLKVWKAKLSAVEIKESLSLHVQFYDEMKSLVQRKIERFGEVVVLDIHSYNHCRDGFASPAIETPEVNIGTGSMPAYRWDTVLQSFLSAFRAASYQGHALDVRENVRFQGGYFPQWIHATFPGQACAIAIEFKKTFMDEWSGECNHQALTQLNDALVSATEHLERQLIHHLQLHSSTSFIEVSVESERRLL